MVDTPFLDDFNSIKEQKLKEIEEKTPVTIGKFSFIRTAFVYVQQHNSKRKIIAFEIFEHTKDDITEYHQLKKGETEYRFSYFMYKKNKSWEEQVPRAMIPPEAYHALMEKLRTMGIKI